MLSRTLSPLQRQGPGGSRRRFRPGRRTLASLVLLGIALTLYMLLPEPGPRLRPMPLDDRELRDVVTTMRATLPSPTREAKEMAALGRRLFHDTGFSANGKVACATCHDPERGFADGLQTSVGLSQTTKNSSTVINTFMSRWFFWDGRADSLASQALKPLEDPAEHGVSRVFVARRLKEKYEREYTKVFGEFPEAMKGDLPQHGMPAAPKLSLSIEVAAYSLATLGSFPLLSDVLDAAQRTRLAPAMELSRRAFLVGPGPVAALPSEWLQSYEKLSEAEKTAIEQVFANFGKAVAAFESGIVAVDSPFDRFAAKLSAGSAPAEALVDGFGERELTGLKLFAGPGQCTLCHAGPLFSDQQFHNTGLSQRGEQIDVGRAAGVLRVKVDPFNCLSGPLQQSADAGASPDALSESCRELPYLDTTSIELVGAMKTPTLRNVAQTAPYMHDGRFASLPEVLRHYNELQGKPATGHREESLQPLDFTEEELGALEAFLVALTSPVRDLGLEEQVGAN